MPDKLTHTSFVEYWTLRNSIVSHFKIQRESLNTNTCLLQYIYTDFETLIELFKYYQMCYPSVDTQLPAQITQFVLGLGFGVERALSSN